MKNKWRKMLVLRAQRKHHHGIRIGNQKKKQRKKRGTPLDGSKNLFFFFFEKKKFSEIVKQSRQKKQFEHPGKETWKSEKNEEMKKMKKKREKWRNLASHAKCWTISWVCRCCCNLFSAKSSMISMIFYAQSVWRSLDASLSAGGRA